MAAKNNVSGHLWSCQFLVLDADEPKCTNNHRLFLFLTREFETRTCRSLMQKMSTDDDETDQTSTQRQSLVSLASSSKGHVPHDRASAARPQQRAVLSQGTSKPQKTIQVCITDYIIDYNIN